jgi:serine/threonine-protein kinase
MNPNAEESYRILGLSLAQQGQMDEAERVLRDALLLPDAGTYAMSTLGYVLARGGNRASAEGVLGQLEQRAENGYVSPIAFVTLFLGLGRWEEAIDWMEKARVERRGWLVYLKVHPILDAVRNHVRFQKLVDRMGL